MKHVVVRCPGCGTDGGAVFDACEACGNQLRGWCLLHSGEIGWLDSITCVRCMEASMRVTAPTRVHAASATPAPAEVTDVAPRADVTAKAAAPVDDPGVPGQVFVLLLTLLITAVGGGLLGIFAGFVYFTRGGGGSPLQFGKAGAIVGVIFGFMAYARSVSSPSTPAPPTSLPDLDRTPPSVENLPPPSFPSPAGTPPSAEYAPPPYFRSLSRTRSPAAAAPPSSLPSPARTRPAAAADPPPLKPSSKWPGGRSPREILRGPPKSLAELGLPDPPPPPTAGDIVSLGVGGAVFGMVAGWVASAVLGVAGASLMAALVLGLGGMIVGIIRFAAFQHAARSGGDG